MAFSEYIQEWFSDQFDQPTEVQERAWEVIEEGSNALVIAPTGSGKTLAAFLSAIDHLMAEKHKGSEERKRNGATNAGEGVKVLYLSPLKALGADVERNLQQPLAQISALMLERCGTEAGVTVGIRTGDTTPEQRRALVRHPPDILITTPESLYLMLTSKARTILGSIETVIVDEIHSIAGSKRGAHLSLSLERLDALLEHPAQRIGLSATVRPLQDIARFLGGVHPVTIVEAIEPLRLDVSVQVPVEDMTNIPPSGASGSSKPASQSRSGPDKQEAWKSDRAMRAYMNGNASPSLSKSSSPDSRFGSASIWPYLEARILEEVLSHRTTIVFVNSRGLCERLTARLNEAYAQQMIAAGKETGASETSLEDVFESIPRAHRSEIGSTTQLAHDAQSQAVIAKAHHGSLAKEKRQMVEAELKRGDIPCVVATSSLELGIDMGAVDLVIQIAPPPSVSSGLQRAGRANHQVGGRSQAIVFPRTRLEVIDAAVAVEGMQEGAIEQTSLVHAPLDVLAQQTVAAASMDSLQLAPSAKKRTPSMHGQKALEEEPSCDAAGIDADEWFDLVRRSANYPDLSRDTFDAVLAMLAGSFIPADEAGFKPRIIWDKEQGLLVGRPGAQRSAVSSVGTIPDRGMYPVVLPEGTARQGRRRVGELDEEMVHESRVGDIITLGTSTWRITQITNDRVMVEAAPGRSSRLPFWHGEGVGRPFEDGFAKGEFLKAAERVPVESDEREEGVPREKKTAFEERLCRIGLDENARKNLIGAVRSQKAATGVLPTNETLVLEVCPDEAGDWRIIFHSPFGRPVHEPWALALAQRIKQERGFRPQVLAQDDGILISIPESLGFVPDSSWFMFDIPELEEIVRASVTQTSLFAARFRECAARALLMSPGTFGKRTPLWLQRLKGSQLLEAAQGYPGFPLFAEALRECLQDVFDMKALREVMGQIISGSIHIHEVHTASPSPFCAPLLFGYVAEHLYEGDMPAAERKASMMAVDPSMLNELLGTVDIGDLVDEDIMREVSRELQLIPVSGEEDTRKIAVPTVEQIADMLRVLGPLTLEEVEARIPSADEAHGALLELEQGKRAFQTNVGGRETWVAAEDAAIMESALGTRVPAWAITQTAHIPSDPLRSLLVRFARHCGPFTTEEAASSFDLGPSIIRGSLEQLRAEGKLLTGHFPDLEGKEGRPEAWVWKDVFDRMRARSLAKARAAVEPVPLSSYMQYLFKLQGIDEECREGEEDATERLGEVIAQFEGVFIEASLWEKVIFPARVSGYEPSLLDNLLASGEVCWVGRTVNCKTEGDATGETRGSALASEKQVAFYPTDSPFSPIAGEAVKPDISEAARYCAELWNGTVMTTSFQAVRVATGTLKPTAPLPRQRRAHSRRGRLRYGVEYQAAAKKAADVAMDTARAHQALAGTWHKVQSVSVDATLEGLSQAESVLDRYGVVTRDTALLSGIPGGISAIDAVLRSMEDRGVLLRGVFVEGLGPVQFADPVTVDAIRMALRDESSCESVEGEFAIISVMDPACLFGQGIPWPPLYREGSEAKDDKPRRRIGSFAIFHEGELILYAAPKLAYLLMYSTDGDIIQQALCALVGHLRTLAKGREPALSRTKLLVKRVNGQSAIGGSFEPYLEQAGFVRLPDGMRLYLDPF